MKLKIEHISIVNKNKLKNSKFLKKSEELDLRTATEWLPTLPTSNECDLDLGLSDHLTPNSNLILTNM